MSIVLHYQRSDKFLGTLSGTLRLLTFKLMILALLSGQRIQTLLKLENMVLDNEECVSHLDSSKDYKARAPSCCSEISFFFGSEYVYRDIHHTVSEAN